MINEHGDMIAITAYYRREAELAAEIQTLERENFALRKEMDEQARLNGKGSEREAALVSKVETLERENAALRVARKEAS